MFKQQYRRLKLLGQGSFGAAYLVHPRDAPDVLFAAKQVRLAHLSPAERDAALAEAELLRRVDHPNVVGHISSFLDGEKLHIIMEYADGGDLSGKIKEHKDEQTVFRESKIMLIFVQLAMALHHIHTRQILHRDLKPMNVFLMKEGVVKLGDFGIARVMESPSAGAQTQIGTPFYLSPEVCKKEIYGSKSDLWSMGVVVYELAALQVPFHAPSLAAVILAICGSDPEPLPDVYSRHLVEVTDRLLEKNPVKRASLDDLLHLESVQHYMKALPSEMYAEAAMIGGQESSSAPQGEMWDGDPDAETLLPSQCHAYRDGDYQRILYENRQSEDIGYDQKHCNLRSTDNAWGESWCFDYESNHDPHISAPYASHDDSPRVGRAKPRKSQDEEEHLAALESARLAAMQDRKVARQRMLAHRADTGPPGTAMVRQEAMLLTLTDASQR